MALLPTALAGAVGSAIASAAVAAAWIGWARRRHLVDLPGARRLHAVPTPRGAGVGIGLVMATAFLLVAPPLAASGVLAFTLVGLLDDVSPKPAGVKLVLQLLAASLITAAFTPAWPMAVLLVLAIAFLVNACNFMDGSNGLLASQGIVLGVALACWPGQGAEASVLAWCLVGACAGFLPFNLPTARGFLGDVGSHAIGASVAASMAWAVLGESMPLPAAVLMLTPILLDTTLTLGRRAAAGKPVWRAHREHLYQYAVRSGFSHLQVCLAYAAWTGMCVLMAFATVNLRSSFVIWPLIILNWSVGVAAYFVLRRSWLRTKRRGVA